MSSWRTSRPWGNSLGSTPAGRVDEDGVSDAPEPVAIGRGARFEGLLGFCGCARIEGSLSGRVLAEGRLVVAQGARVEARVEVDELVVEGQLRGDIVGRRWVRLAPTARVTGNLVAPRLELAEGCRLEGDCRTPDPDPGPDSP